MDRENIFDAIKKEENWVMVESSGIIRYVCRPLPGYKCPDKTWTRILVTTEEYPYIITDSIGGYELLTEKQLFKHFNFASSGERDRSKLTLGKDDSLYHTRTNQSKTEEEEIADGFMDKSYSEPINDKTLSKRLIYNKVLDWTPVRKNDTPVWAFYLDARKYTDNIRDLKMKFLGDEYILNKTGETERFHYDFLLCDDNYVSPDLSYIIPIKNRVFMTNYDSGEFPQAETVDTVEIKKPHSLFKLEYQKDRILKEETAIRQKEHADIINNARALDVFLQIYLLESLHYFLNRPEMQTVREVLYPSMSLVFGEMKAGSEGSQARVYARALLSLEIKKIRNGALKDELMFTAMITRDYALRMLINYQASTGGKKNVGIKEKSAALLKYLSIIDENVEKYREISHICLKKFNKHDILFGEYLKEAIEMCPDMFNETIVSNNNRIEYLLQDTYNTVMQTFSEKGTHGWKIF